MPFKIDETHKTFDAKGRQVAAELFSGKLYFRHSPRINGSLAEIAAQTDALTEAGGFHHASENSNFRGWWLPVPAPVPAKAASEAA